MTRIEWLANLEEVARDPDAASGPRVRALELIGREAGFIVRERRPWWLRWTKEEES